MGTRADFYVGRGKDAEWLGSVAWDGHPDNDDYAFIFGARDEATYRGAVADLLERRDDGTVPADGWPWPWEDSNTTDYAYAFDGSKVYGCNFGSPWFDVLQPEPEDESESAQEFPNMKDRQNVTFGKRSGVMVFGFPNV